MAEEQCTCRAILHKFDIVSNYAKENKYFCCGMNIA